MTDTDKVLRIARAMALDAYVTGNVPTCWVKAADGDGYVPFGPLDGGADGAAMLDWLRERGDVSLSTEGGKAFCLFEPFTDADDDWTERSADDDWHAIGEAVIAVAGEE